MNALINKETIRALDLVLVAKGNEGSVDAAELRDADDSQIGTLRALESDLSVLRAEEDVEHIGATSGPGSMAAVLECENTWAGAVRLGRAQVGG